MLTGKRILLIIGGGISAYKSLDLIRKLRERGAAVTPVLTGAATEFVTRIVRCRVVWFQSLWRTV